MIKEDTYGVPDHMEGLSEKLKAQPLLKSFVAMPLAVQHQVLVLIDFFSNAIAQGLPEMNMPFEFKTVSEWRQLGVTPLAGIRDTTLAALFQPDGPGTPAYLLTGNYRVILQYNCSNYYALSVGLLADEIAR